MGRGLAVPAALPVPPAGACVCSAGDHGLALWVPFFPGGVSLTFYFSKFLLCSLPSPKTRRASPSELSFAFAIGTEQRLSAKSLSFHRSLLATHRNVGIAEAFSYSSKSLFSLPFSPISSRGTFHVSYHMVHSRQLARGGMHTVNSLFLLTHLRVPFYPFQPYRVSLSYS